MGSEPSTNMGLCLASWPGGRMMFCSPPFPTCRMAAIPSSGLFDGLGLGGGAYASADDRLWRWWCTSQWGQNQLLPRIQLWTSDHSNHLVLHTKLNIHCHLVCVPGCKPSFFPGCHTPQIIVLDFWNRSHICLVFKAIKQMREVSSFWAQLIRRLQERRQGPLVRNIISPWRWCHPRTLTWLLFNWWLCSRWRISVWWVLPG